MSSAAPREHRPGIAPDAPPSVRFAHRLRAVSTEGVVHVAILVVVLIVVSVLLAVLRDTFLTTSNIVAILQTMAVICIASIGQTIAIVSGGFDLSVGGVLPLAGVVYAITANAVPGFAGMLVGIVVALVVGALFGLLNGAFITKLRINPMITTLGTLSVAGGAAYVFSQGTTVVLSNADGGDLAGRVVGGLTWDVVLLVVLALAASFVLHLTITGRIVYALGGSRMAVRRAGIRADRATIGVYVASAALAALAGVVAASQLLAAAPNTYSDAALSSVTAVILGGAALTGGRGTVLGTVLGSLLLGVIANGLNLLQINTFYQTIITGVVLLVAVGLTKVRDAVARSTEAD